MRPNTLNSISLLKSSFTTKAKTRPRTTTTTVKARGTAFYFGYDFSHGGLSNDMIYPSIDLLL